MRSANQAAQWFACFAVAIASGSAMADEPPTFYRAFNLNGPALTIDGHAWEAGNARGMEEDLASFENQSVRLSPATDDARAQMIRSSRYASNMSARLRLVDVPPGTYSVYLYVWEDNDPQKFDIQLGGKLVAKAYNSGPGGHWDRLGPWVVDVSHGTIELTAVGGHANLSGLEIWRGKLSPSDNPLSGSAPANVAKSREAAAAVLIARNCLECHNASDHKGGLDLTRRDRALAGGDSGSALTPGKPADSLLLKRIAEEEMPPPGRRQLSADEQSLLRQWVQSGATWAADPIDPFLYTSDRRAGYNWWSLQPLRAIEPPRVVDNGPMHAANAPVGAGSARTTSASSTWPINPIDNFILERLMQAGLQPAPEADRRTLIRRLSFDLIGLPPTPEEVNEFVNDQNPLAYQRLVERLLDSPHYGERWARHWLDIVRYGESQGFERNKLRPNAWKYRDFVVEAFNSDLPYDEFIRWQIAGDVLHPEDPLAVIATGFLTLGPYDLTAYTNGTADMQAFAREEELEGLVATVGQTFLGLTVNCSRCHDHKFDPITQKEFYQISAALGGTFHGDEREVLSESARTTVSKRAAALRGQIQELAAREKGADQRSQRTLGAQRSRFEAVERLLQSGPVHTTVPKQPGPWAILARGDFRKPGEIVGARGIAAVSGVSPDWSLSPDAPEAERRKALAHWIAHPHNPLTARVIVNRLWTYHFGDGLVRTPSDLGFQGGFPSHPELLDWMAGQLVQPTDGPAWSLKRIQRLIVLSATYRQSSRTSSKGSEVDADNRLIWKRSAQRLEAETYRDTVLAVAGELDERVGGPGFRDFTISSAGNNETYTVFDALGADFNRRSLYRTCVRTGTSPLLDTLDCPDPSVATPRRTVTSTPLQALTLLNDAFAEHYAARFAERLKREAPDDPVAQIRRAYALAFGRQPSDEDATWAKDFVAKLGLQQFCLVLFNANEFMFVD